MKRQVIILLILMMTANIFALTKQEYIKALRKGPKAKITFRVVDDENHPVTNAYMRIGFIISDSPGGYIPFKGYTDTNGMFSAKGKLRNEITYNITKKGYYTTSGAYHFRKSHCYDRIKHGKWQPWNPTIEVILREKKNPVPMYAKRVDTKIPVTGKYCGYDLMVGDWVAPYGNGKVEDFIFMINGWWKNYRNNDSYLTLSFLHTSDGIMAVKPVVPSSEFKMQRYAPESGYKNQIKWHMKRTQKPGYQNDEIIDEVNIKERGYIFRIRSQTNEYGVVTNALYGKVSSNFGFAGAAEKGGSWLRFTYYLNPTPNDRNMEFDPKKNLFKNLKSFEYPICP